MSIIIPTQSDAFSEIGSVSSDAFSGVLPYLYVVIGIALAFYIIQTIRFWMSDYPERYDKIQERERQKNDSMLE
jgi:hypothetical protein